MPVGAIVAKACNQKHNEDGYLDDEAELNKCHFSAGHAERVVHSGAVLAVSQ